jgi:prepilin-type N-terminal cleavage/methylation domain-containing protein/prepilin-type processing-associated H-X9-DG protein
MKTNPRLKNRQAFTLVELLVVIVIIAALAAITFSLAARMKKKGEAAKSIRNLRQIGTMTGVYAADNSMKIPALKGASNPPGSVDEVLWHEALLFMAYPDVDRAKIKWSTPWWKSNKPFLMNPLMTDTSRPKAFSPWFNGYAYNYQITARLGAYDEGVSPSMASFSEPTRTPFVVPYWNTRYATKDIAGNDMKSFLVDNRMSVLFVDGHVENMKPDEYLSRKLDDMPKRP